MLANTRNDSNITNITNYRLFLDGGTTFDAGIDSNCRNIFAGDLHQHHLASFQGTSDPLFVIIFYSAQDEDAIRWTFALRPWTQRLQHLRKSAAVGGAK